MSVTISLTNQEIAQIRQITQQTSDSDAVSAAVREFLRTSRLRELKAVSGKVEFDDNWQQLESLEIGESPFPLRR